MKIDSKWIKVLALALCLPSTILAMGYFFYFVVKNELINPLWAILLFLTVVGGVLFLMVRYAYSIKNKS